MLKNVIIFLMLLLYLYFAVLSFACLVAFGLNVQKLIAVIFGMQLKISDVKRLYRLRFSIIII